LATSVSQGIRLKLFNSAPVHLSNICILAFIRLFYANSNVVSLDLVLSSSMITDTVCSKILSGVFLSSSFVMSFILAFLSNWSKSALFLICSWIETISALHINAVFVASWSAFVSLSVVKFVSHFYNLFSNSGI